MDTLIVFGAEFLIVPVVLTGVAAALWRAEGRRRMFLLLAVALPLGYMLARLAGFLYSHPQPFAVEGFEPLIPHAVDNAFPSDHTLLSGIFASVAFLADRRVGLLLWVLTIFIGAARVLAGLHYPADIAASVVLALCVVWAAHAGLKRMI